MIKNLPYLLCPTKLYSSNNIKLNKLLLGTWCLSYKKNIKNKNICDYPWDNKKKLLLDYEYISKVNKTALKKLSKYLNNYHGINENNDYWKIILGSWVATFLATIYERWGNFQNSQKYPFKYVVNTNRDYVNFVPRNFENFYQQTTTDSWNQYIYEDIFKFYLNKNYFVEKKNNKTDFNNQKKKVHLKRKIFEFVNFFLSRIFFYKKRKYIVCESYLGKIDEIKLNLKLGSPLLTLSPIYPEIETKLDLRRISDRVFDKNEIKQDPFLVYLNSMLLKNIPVSFLEQFKFIKEFAAKLEWPVRPRLLFTSHALLTKTLCSFYFAEKKKIGCKLVHGQHGGYYGTALFNTFEELELDISDKYLTWGWTKVGKYKNKIIKFGCLKPKIKLSNTSKKFFLFILKSNSRFANKIHSGAGSNNLLRYFYDCESFLKNINYKIKKDIILRRHARTHDWPEEKKICKMFDKNQVDQGNTNITKLINKSKLIIHTYNSTGFLETLAANKPTIIFFNNIDYPLNIEAKKYFNYLKDANILFYDWKEAVLFLNNNYNSIDGWWNSNKTQDARKKFCSNFARLNDNKIDKLVKIIRQI